jgi:hypothetical protein
MRARRFRRGFVIVRSEWWCRQVPGFDRILAVTEGLARRPTVPEIPQSGFVFEPHMAEAQWARDIWGVIQSSAAVNLWKQSMSAMSAADRGILTQLFADDAWFHDPVAGVLEAGRIPDYLGTLVGTHFDRLEVQLLDSVTQGDRAAIEWRQTTWSGQRRHELEGTSFITQRDGRLIRMRDYFQFPPTKTSRTSAIT